MTGQPSAVVTSSGLTGAMNQAGTGTPAPRNSRLARSLSIASALASGPLPVYGTPMTSSTAWSVPPSSVPPCTARKITSASRTGASLPSPSDNIRRSRSASASTLGGAAPPAPPNGSPPPPSSAQRLALTPLIAQPAGGTDHGHVVAPAAERRDDLGRARERDRALRRRAAREHDDPHP